MKKSDYTPNRSGLQVVTSLLLALSAIIFLRCSGNTSDKFETATALPDSVYIFEGNRIVALTFDTLSASLKGAIGKFGMEGAISFCNEKANTLTSTYADTVMIRRTSLRYRNPGNKPDSVELAVLNEMDIQVKSGNALSPKIVRNLNTGDVHFFKPILLQPMCLNCHGIPTDQVKDATLTRIRQLYPSDQAVNYKPGDLRGTWHIVFKR